MAKYIVEFSKVKTMCYISHLDLIRLFKRLFKRADIKLTYSQGFNPHPKMGFAQPLSLGYWGLRELLEFETEEDLRPEDIREALRGAAPDGIEIIDCRRWEGGKKTLAALTEAAEYFIGIPLKMPLTQSGEELQARYMGQAQILALKRQKKKKEPVQVDIKPMIRRISFLHREEALFAVAVLDSGSASNLSPELVLDTVKSCFGLGGHRSEAEIMRTRIICHKL